MGVYRSVVVPTAKSWRTAAAGVVAFIVALGTALMAQWDGEASTEPNWNVVVVALITMIGLLTARDNNVSDEEAEAKEPNEKPPTF